MHTTAFDLVVWLFSVVFDIFFREILPRGSYRIPRQGPVILVGAPHANQFVDGMMLMRIARHEAGRRLSFLIAKSSLDQAVVGSLSRLTNGIGVYRAQDMLKPATGKIYANDADPLVIKGVGTKFTTEAMARGLLGLPNSLGNAEISEIRSDTELVLRKEFKGSRAQALLKEGTLFKVAPHVDQSSMYQRVFTFLNEGGCLGIYPEGGSHDRPDLLPLKAGVAIMALGAMAQYPECKVKIVPCGMNYFHAHKFRSRCVIEFGEPFTISQQLVDQYKAGGNDRREAVRQVLEDITDSLRAVTVMCPDFETMMVIQAARRLYRPAAMSKGGRKKKLPLSVIVELNRRLLTGYMHFKDNAQVIELRKNVTNYNKRLRALGLKDHQVESANMKTHIVVVRLVSRVLKLIVLLIGSLPGTILFAPVFIATKIISHRRAAHALKKSTVKIQAHDVIATWKVLVALGLTPLLYTVYALLAAFITYRYQLFGPSATWRTLVGVVMASYVILPLITYAALLTGEVGMDIFKSLRPLAMALSPFHKSTVESLRKTRNDLTAQITELVNTLGPEIFPDFNKYQAGVNGTDDNDNDEEVENVEDDSASQSEDSIYQSRIRSLSTTSVSSMSSTGSSSAISRVNSESNLANMPLFSSVRPARDRDESPATSLSDAGEPSGTGTETFQTEVSRRIRGAMAARRKEE